MRARARTNLALLLAVAVLGTAVLLIPEPRPERPPRAVDFDPDTIDTFTLDRLDRSGSIRFERRAGEWVVTAPAEGNVDSGHVARALATLRVRTSSCYPAADREPDEFGLDPPQATVELGPVTVEFGYRSPDGRRYVRAQGRLCLVDDVTLPILTGRMAKSAPDG